MINKQVTVTEHYDLLIEENNDPVMDPKPLQMYMDKWDGQNFIDKLISNKEKVILEIGVGTGRLALKALNGGYKNFYGIDLSEKTIERAKYNLTQFSNVELICDDFLSYNFNVKFDIIYSSLTFFHIENKRAAIVKVSDLLNSKGRFVLSIERSTPKIFECGTRYVKMYPDYVDNIADLLIDSGLNIESIDETDFASIITATKE